MIKMKGSALAFMALAWGIIFIWMYLAVSKLLKAEQKS
ncbi:hypothetical protein TSIB_1112 [Thermococcus sibiricus MM 739]|uniref:Uncharacterized protein n=1 Tax=Thermococcus sibiricus (strain DSM 12597 / MM 739) TaxID=604354 RepID=C6A3H1_THESM|nr:hypothetical protein TSIB_1112 [Thermococcus sibiricus MM 739]